MEQITAKTNRWIKLAGQLKLKKYRDEYDMFLAEGIRSAEDLLNQEIRDVVCLVQNDKVFDSRIEEVIRRGTSFHWLFLSVEGNLWQRISATEHGQGILMLIKKKKSDIQVLYDKAKAFWVLLDGVQDPGNMGTIIRTAAAAGCSGVLLTKGCADTYNEKTIRSSMGSILRIPLYEDVDISFVKTLSQETGRPLIGTALCEAKSYHDVPAIHQGIFIFGNEGNGIQKELLAMTDFNLFIPLSNEVESLNVSAAAAIILFKYVNHA